MTTDIVSGHLDESVEEVMETMTERRFRHMPVLQDGKLVGIISIGDLVKSQLRHYERQVSELTDYVAGKRRVSERPPRQRRSGPPLFPSTVYRLPFTPSVRGPETAPGRRQAADAAKVAPTGKFSREADKHSRLPTGFNVYRLLPARRSCTAAKEGPPSTALPIPISTPPNFP